jgi:hypothetical protein
MVVGDKWVKTITHRLERRIADRDLRIMMEEETNMGGPGSGRKKGSSGIGKKSTGKTFSVSPSKMKNKPIPPALKKKFKKEGGVNSPAYKAWIEKNWKS